MYRQAPQFQNMNIAMMIDGNSIFRLIYNGLFIIIVVYYINTHTSSPWIAHGAQP